MQIRSDCNVKMTKILYVKFACGHGGHEMMIRSTTINPVRDGIASVWPRYMQYAYIDDE